MKIFKQKRANQSPSNKPSGLAVKNSGVAIKTRKTSPGLLEYGLVFMALMLIWAHHQITPPKLTSIFPASAYEYSVVLQYRSDQQDLFVSTYLPKSNERQRVLDERIESGVMEQSLYDSVGGLKARWSSQAGSGSIHYKALVASQGYRVRLPESLGAESINSEGLAEYLKAPNKTQFDHAQIETLWASIKPSDTNNLIEVLDRIYTYTHELSLIPMGNDHDAVAALTMGKASALDKSRLFITLARLNDLPARMVGGVVLDTEREQPAHYWVEVNIDNQWVPFDPAEGHFATLPKNYLELYFGDQALFTSSSEAALKPAIRIKNARVSPAIYSLMQDEEAFSLAKLLTLLQIPKEMIGVFLLLPLTALCITFLRNVVGIKSFGVFMPMLIGAACSVMGLAQGLIGFTLIVLVAFVAHLMLGPMKLLKIPRLAIVLTIINLVCFAILALFNQLTGMTFGMLALFPLVIISFVADKLHELSEDSEWEELFYTTVGTLVSILISYLVLKSVVLKGLFAIYPELFLLVIAAQINLGRWTGIRLSEMFRFSGLIRNSDELIGINCRNRDLVYQLNSHEGLRIAADKLETKRRLVEANIPVPDTWATFSSFSEIKQLRDVLEDKTSFVVKPNQGSQGKGIAVISSRIQDELETAGGRPMTMDDIETLIAEIISGQYSQLGDADTAFIEPLIRQHQGITDIAPHGLADIRLILSKGIVDGKAQSAGAIIQSAMLRLPTAKSGGKANIHQGAIGAAIALDSGTVTRCLFKGKTIQTHPDSQKSPLGLILPHWQQIKEISLNCAEVIPLGYIGVDICIDHQLGPLVLEVNGRPGLEIQNVQNAGLKHRLLSAPVAAENSFQNC